MFNLDLGKVYIGIGINLHESHGFTCLTEHTDQKLDKYDIMKGFSDEFMTLEKLMGKEDNSNKGIRELLNMYESLWMHNG